MPILVTRDLTRAFGDFIAVDSLNLSVEGGEIFALLGPNGAGKSTALRMLATLLPPTSGDAVIDGLSITHQANGVRRIIGYVPQMLSADGSLTGYENLMIFAKLYDIPSNEREERVAEALSFMGLEDAAAKLVSRYSGGMIRRLEIAQSMMHRPRLLFLDEPTVGLDPIAREAVWRHILELQKEFGTTIMMTTHLMEEADTTCSRVALMARGKIVALDTPERLKSSLQMPGATLDDVFIHYAGSAQESAQNFKEISRERRTARRLG
ncbi:MAG TPA: ATP-binding cassette domain-containing protein [Candidatus Kapabacteria bacterium]|nr:ATP-binding cassette domain-containing protein [Candidatus Kapabacteria bacterium]